MSYWSRARSAVAEPLLLLDEMAFLSHWCTVTPELAYPAKPSMLRIVAVYGMRVWLCKTTAASWKQWMFWFNSVGTRSRDLCNTYFHAGWVGGGGRGRRVGRWERGGGWIGGRGEEGGEEVWVGGRGEVWVGGRGEEIG